MKIYLSPTVRMKFIHYTLLIATLLLSSNVYAQISTNEPPPSFTTQLRITAKVDEEVITGLPNMNQILKEDIQDSINGMPPRFGYPLKINLNTENSGTWETLSDGSKMWRLTIYSPKALSINLLYDKFWLPDNTKFFIYNEKKTQSIGAFTSSNNKGDKGKPEKFATEIMYGDRITLEYYQPQGVNERPVISIAFVVHGYRYINISNEFTTLGLGSSLSCNINVNCWQGSPYQLQKRAVALIVVGGARWCTGSLINNTSNNMQPYFLTADHCLNGLDAVTNPNAYYWSFMWNYESPTCANPPSDPGYYTTSGATVVANHQPTDMALLRLTEDPKNLSCYAPSYTGWSRSSAGAISSAGMHHPAGDIKKIWFTYDAAVSNSSPIPWSNGTTSPVNSHWVVNITSGTTEGGSSGSFMLNQDKRIVGQLHGGASGCAPITKYFGRFDVSWNGGGNAQRRLRDWLDPTGTNQTTTNTIEWNIVGPQIICTSGTYVLQNPPSGATITWSLTTTGVFNLTPSGSSATLTKISDGSDTLRAMVGSCIIASKDVTTITIPEIHNTQYGTCSGTWQEWYLQASSNNGGSNWQWYPGTLPPGVQVNIYNPNSSSTYASVSGGAAAVLLNFVDNCGNPVNAGTTIYSPCPSLTLFQAIFLPERKSIKVELTQLEGNEKIDPQKFLLGKNIEKLTVFAPNEESATLEKAFATGSYEAERRIRSKGRQIFGGN